MMRLKIKVSQQKYKFSNNYKGNFNNKREPFELSEKEAKFISNLIIENI
jgi:hypothetical protein